MSYKVILVGDSGVGKSSLLTRYFYNEFSNNHNSTIGVDCESKEINVKEKTVRLQIWDTAGHEKFRNITTSYYRNTHCFILLFDITNKESFDNLHYWYEEIKKFCTVNDPLIVLIGTKKDLRNERTVYYDTIIKFSSERNFKYFETSSKQNDGIYYIFDYIADILVDKFPEKEKDKNIIQMNNENNIMHKNNINCCN